MKYALRKVQSFIINLSNVIFLFSGKRNDKTLYTEILCIISINQIQTLVVVFQYVSMIEGKNLLRVFFRGGGREGSLCNVKGGGDRNTIKYWPVMVCYDLKKKRPAMEIPLHLKLTTPGYHFARVFFVVFVVMDDLLFFPL